MLGRVLAGVLVGRKKKNLFFFLKTRASTPASTRSKIKFFYSFS